MQSISRYNCTRHTVTDAPAPACTEVGARNRQSRPGGVCHNRSRRNARRSRQRGAPLLWRVSRDCLGGGIALQVVKECPQQLNNQSYNLQSIYCYYQSCALRLAASASSSSTITPVTIEINILLLLPGQHLRPTGAAARGQRPCSSLFLSVQCLPNPFRRTAGQRLSQHRPSWRWARMGCSRAPRAMPGP